MDIRHQAVHAAGGRLFAQLWHVGRISHASLYELGGAPVGPSAMRAERSEVFAWLPGGRPGMVSCPPPKALSTNEVGSIPGDFAVAAQNAVDAGFDGVELHGANGYLLDQFLNPRINDRSDAYRGTTIEGRSRLTLESVDAVAERIGAQRTAIRPSPYGRVFDAGLYEGIDQTFLSLSAHLAKRNLAYVHLMDHPRAQMSVYQGSKDTTCFDRLRERMRATLGRTPLILAGGLTAERAGRLIREGAIDLAAFGRLFIPNPDLVERFRNG